MKFAALALLGAVAAKKGKFTKKGRLEDFLTEEVRAEYPPEAVHKFMDLWG